MGGDAFSHSNKKNKSGEAATGNELYMQLIKKQFDEINAKEEMHNTKNLEALKKQQSMQKKQHEQRKQRQL